MKKINRPTFTLKPTAEPTPKQQPADKKQAPQKLLLLVAIVSQAKTEFYMDFLQSFQINMQMALPAKGTASTETMQYLGLTDSSKTVILNIIREDQAHAALLALEHKFKTIRNGKGIAYTIPLTGTIGVAIYRFLSNTER